MKNKIENRFKCPVKLWNNFSDKGKIAYNNIRGLGIEQILPTADDCVRSDFNVISHNYACFAAWEF